MAERFWGERWGITEEEWKKALSDYFNFGEELFLALGEENLRRFKGLVVEERIEAALHLLCYHYGVPGVSVVREKGEPKGVLLPARYIPEQRKIVLYERAFEYPPGPVDTLLYGFSYHLQEFKHPLWLYDERLKRMQREDPERALELKGKFARGFVGIGPPPD